ncbi:MAG: Glycerophosphocholine phosphodiesterase [Sclerophora amabilis]|nr:MAG: Glycerophosphocholine phosphodiesterase [Sclerophora amabilis]
MKFGRDFHQRQLPEWAPFYVDYNALKRLFKAACSTASGQSADADFTDLVAALDRELNKVESFYVRKFANIQRRAASLYERYGISRGISHALDWKQIDKPEIAHLLGVCVELLNELEKLRWFGKVNKDGLQKVFDKVASRRSSSGRDHYKNGLELHRFQFADQSQCRKELEQIDGLTADLNRASVQRPSNSISSSLFLHNFCARFQPSFASPNAAYRALVEDDSAALGHMLDQHGHRNQGVAVADQPLLRALLQCAVLRGSKECISILLLRVDSLEDDNSPDSDNCLHRLSTSLGSSKSLTVRQPQRSSLKKNTRSLEDEPERHSSLDHILSALRSNQHHALVTKDSFGRQPLHYAASHGLEGVCKLYLGYMQDQGRFPLSTASDSVLSQDEEGHTPLHLAVIGGHTNVTKILLEVVGKKHDLVEGAENQNLKAISGPILAIALKSNFVEIVKLLVAPDVDVDINYQGSCGETALYIAARTAREDSVKVLLASGHKINVDLAEAVHGWPPLFIACVEGHLPILELLLEAGANFEMRDSSGWTAKEHAAFRGHIKVAEWITAYEVSRKSDSRRPANCQSGQDVSTRPLDEPMQGGSRVPSSSKRPGVFRRTINTESESQILVTLGPSNTRSHRSAFDFSSSLDYAEAPHPEAGYSLEVSAIGATGSSQIIDLPLLEDKTNEPWWFATNDPEQVRLVFNLFRLIDHHGGKRSLVGRSIALLRDLRQRLASTRESLVRDHTIPILEQETLNFIGTVTFNLLIVTPCPNPGSKRTINRGFWGKQGHTPVVGHRGRCLSPLLTFKNVDRILEGSGANSAERNSLQLGENTIQVDVQLTKDLAPVIFHDFLLVETGAATPLHTLSQDQIIHLGKAQSSRGEISRMAEVRYLERSHGKAHHSPRPRARSVDVYDDYRSDDLVERMKQTTDEGDEIKGNLRGCSIQSLLPTLEEMLVKLPKSTSFDLEMKYPMLWEAEDRNMDTYATELNVFVDTVLEKIYRLGGERNISFSSFSPEMCIALSIKQKDHPVLLISKAGSVPVGDVRVGSLQSALHFAKSWDLAGIVMLSDPLVMCPRLVQYAKSSGLVCCSYGNLNDDPQNAMIQVDAGLDAIIVNKVRLISETISRATS